MCVLIACFTSSAINPNLCSGVSLSILSYVFGCISSNTLHKLSCDANAWLSLILVSDNDAGSPITLSL